MHGRTLRESISSIIGVDDIDQSRLTITPQRKLELEAEQKKLTYFFRFDTFLNFDANLSGYRNEDYDQQTSWFFYFIDIIYVATIFNISHLITKCGQDTKVYVMAASYFTIMFTTRMFFDTFTSILHANGVLHTMIFILYGLGVYCMTVNIAAVTDDISIAAICSGGIGDLSTHIPSTYSLAELYTQDISSINLHRLLQSSNSSGSVDNTFGSCRQVENFDFGFALSFLFTRSLIFVLFFLYCTVFHHTKDHAKSSSNGHHPGINANKSQNTANIRMNETSLNSESSTVPGSMDGSNSIELVSVTLTESDNHATDFANSTTADTMTRTTSATTANHSSHRAHINKVFVYKIIPLIISCIVMLFTFAEISTVVIFPMVAIIEIVGDVLPELIVNMEGIKPDRHNLEERLGLMFMLVLGETMLGFLVQRGNAVIDAKTYSTLIPAYILVIAVGMQYFKNAQFPHLAPGKHPLDRPIYSAVYTWLSAMLSFLMLVAANGLVEIYNEISDLGARSESVQEQVEMKKISVCLFGVWVIMLCLHLLEGSYWDVIVRSLWVKWCNTCRRCAGCVTGRNATTASVVQELHSTKEKSEVDSLGTTALDANPMHYVTTQDTATDDIHSTGGNNRASVSERPSVSEPSHYPYSIRNARHTLHYSHESNHDTTEAKSATPAIFNKRLFFLRLGVAFVHLYTHSFNIDAQYFIVVNAMVALVPQLAEAILEFVDLQQRLSQIRRELNLKVDEAL